MLQPVAGRALRIALGVCSYLLLFAAGGVTQLSEQSVPHLPGAQFGGTFRRMLGANPVTLDPALVTDSYGVTVVNQIFEVVYLYRAGNSGACKTGIMPLFHHHGR